MKKSCLMLLVVAFFLSGFVTPVEAIVNRFGMTPGNFARYEFLQYTQEPEQVDTAFLTKIKYGKGVVYEATTDFHMWKLVYMYQENDLAPGVSVVSRRDEVFQSDYEAGVTCEWWNNGQWAACQNGVYDYEKIRIRYYKSEGTLPS